MEDADLVRACREGDAAAWAELKDRHGPLMLRAARLRTTEAEEACQRAWARLSTDGGKALGSFQGRSSLGTWLAAVAVNEAAHLDRSEERLKERELGHPSPEESVPTPLQALCRQEGAGQLREAMAELPPRDRLLLTLVYWDGLSPSDAARVIHVEPKSVSMLLQRARERLKEKIGASL